MTWNNRYVTQSFELTFILFSYFLSSEELSYRPRQHVLGHKQCTDKQRQAMLGKRQQWVPYTSFNPTFCLSLLRAWNIRVDGDPGTWEDGNETAPDNIPDCPAVREVSTTIWRQWAVVNGWDRAGTDWGPLDQVVDEEEKQHLRDMWIANVKSFKYRKDVWAVLNTRKIHVANKLIVLIYRQALMINKTPVSIQGHAHQVKIH